MRRLAAALTAIVCCTAGAGAIDNTALTPADCDAPSQASPVCAASRAWNAADAEAALGPHALIVVSEGDTLSVLVRQSEGPVSACCTISAPMVRIAGSDLWTLSFKLYRPDRAVLDIGPTASGANAVVYYGAHVPQLPITSRLLGTLVDDTLDSGMVDGPRRLTVYLPPSYDKSRRYPVVYLADGQALRALAPGIEAQIVVGRARPLIVVGLWAAPRLAAAQGREYLLGTPEYNRHNAFVFSQAMAFVERKYGASARPEDRMLAGFSGGGAWALSAGIAHAKEVGNIAAFSLDWRPALYDIEASDRPRLYLAAGFLEPQSDGLTAEAASRARAAPAPLLFEEFASGHALIAWRTMLLDALAWSFPRQG
ncbi:MAG TPA: alpha/beta hydrolase-fold protein [Rhizomicrobium sp.]